ncbi:hypothetical protein S40288_01035 [Stachybotrys chartarum IBT 40288]|nr:hypothetical protein S40288_01035 [Stachybotrys chartarum IBT 40288]
MSSSSKPRILDYARYITTTDATGKAVFSKSDAAQVTETIAPGGAAFSLDYVTQAIPPKIADNADIDGFHALCDNAETALASLPPSFHTDHGVVLRHFAFPPGLIAPMHQTETLDFVIILEGSIDLLLDSGEERNMRKGDTVVQRGTRHAWRNTSESEWVIMLCVVMPVSGSA